MSRLKLPFKLGANYEDLEFSLEILPDRVPQYDSYLFVGTEVHIFLNNHTHKTELVYNLDTLEAVILTFKKSTASFKKMNDELTKRFSKPTVEVRNNTELHYYSLESIYVCSSKSSNELQIVYSSNYCLYISVLSTLIC